MRTTLITLVAILSLASFTATAVASVAPSGGGSSGVSSGGGGGGGGGHAGGGGGGGGHAGGGGGGAHGGGGGGAHAGAGGHLGGGFAGGGGWHGGGGGNFGAHGSYLSQGFSAGHSSYGIVSYRTAGLGRGGAAPVGNHGPQSTSLLGPRTGSAATAKRVAQVMPAVDRARPPHPHQPRHKLNPYNPYAGCASDPRGCYEIEPELPWAFCNQDMEHDGKVYQDLTCPQMAKWRPRSGS